MRLPESLGVIESQELVALRVRELEKDGELVAVRHKEVEPEKVS